MIKVIQVAIHTDLQGDGNFSKERYENKPNYNSQRNTIEGHVALTPRIVAQLIEQDYNVSIERRHRIKSGITVIAASDSCIL